MSIDFSKLKTLNIGGVELTQLSINGVQVWKIEPTTEEIALVWSNGVKIDKSTGAEGSGSSYADPTGTIKT